MTSATYATSKEAIHDFEKIGVLMILLYGSRAKNSHSPSSDYDISVLFESGKAAKTIAEYRNLMDLISSHFDIPLELMDITLLNQSDSLLLCEILSSNKLLYGDIDFYLQWECRTMFLHIDNARLRELERAMVYRNMKYLNENRSS